MHLLKQLIKYLILSIVNLLVKKKSTVQPKTILLIRLDAIGDYVLFRNFIEILKNQYPDYKITLVGNIAWKTIAEEFDTKFIHNFIWINRNKFEKNPIYRYKTLQKITNQGYEIVINPTFSRTFFSDDSIVKTVSAKEKIGSVGDLSNIKIWQKNISDKYYTKLISAKQNIMFEFDRNREFIENLFDKKINIQKPHLELEDINLQIELPQKYAVLFIGASAKFRKWNIANFVEIGKFLKENYNYDILVCGGPTDLDEVTKFKELAKYNYLDLVGKTSLIELLYIIYNGNLMVTNETSAPHFAVSLEMTNIFVVSNGNHFGRFTPYPKEILQGYYPIYHPEIEIDLDDYKKLSHSYGFGSQLNINEISIKQVKEKIGGIIGQS